MAFYLGVIPARGGSKRLPGKNLALLAGKPLIAYSIDAARRSTRMGRTVVSTDDPRIAQAARVLGADVPFLRPAEMAQDESSAIALLQHALAHVAGEGAAVDAVVLLQPTSPLRTAEDIDRAIDAFERTGADTVTSVCPAKEHPYWSWTLAGDAMKPFFSDRHMAIGRHELPPAVVENGAVFVVKPAVLAGGTLYGRKIVPYLMDGACSVDIDTPEDLERAAMLLSRTPPTV